MSAWTPMHRMIGVSGAMTKPEVCIVAGVSGAAAFYAGIEKSKTIVAINTDIRAPIIKASDVAVIDDYKAVMAELAKIVLN
jgi:electron transfer flavoprotein alpha subunit